jgi:hypothetical protein
MRAAGYTRSFKAQVGDPLNDSHKPVYVPTEKGCCALAMRTCNIADLLDLPPATNNWVSYAHNTSVSDLFSTLDRSMAAQPQVKMNALYFEHDLVNANESDPAKRYRLYTIVKVLKTEKKSGDKTVTEEKKIVCVPDAACELQFGDRRIAYLWELERGTDTPNRAGAKKAPGYYWMGETGKWKRFFPHAEDFRVMAVCPNAVWRDAMRSHMRERQGAEHWRFRANDESTAEGFLTSRSVRLCHSGGEGPTPRLYPRPEGLVRSRQAPDRPASVETVRCRPSSPPLTFSDCSGSTPSWSRASWKSSAGWRPTTPRPRPWGASSSSGTG